MIKGIGVDIVSLERLDNETMNRLSKKVLSKSEIEEMMKIVHQRRKKEFFGGRFSAKEAFFKALGTGVRIDFLRLITVSKDPYGKPLIKLDAEATGKLDLSDQVVHLSISHDSSFVVSMVVIEEKQKP